MKVELVPVIDLLGGRVVRGVAGRRDEYRPIQSRLTDSTQPRAIAQALIEHLLPARLYLADLDAIAGAPPAWGIYRELQSLGPVLWIDAGVRSVAEAVAVADAGIEGVICGLETVSGPQELKQILAAIGLERVVFSLDLKGGEPMSTGTAWPASTLAIAQTVIALGIRRLIVLDLARVGMGSGIGTEQLCSRILEVHPNVELYAGGGIRDPEDLQRLAACGIHGALVASALHDGRITRGNVDGAS
jgi:phosphoribosylformimino-5-aminoimidazole carboxamide ribotide isomerase